MGQAVRVTALSPRSLLLWMAGIGTALLLAPTLAGAVILAIADVRATTFHWRLATNYGPTEEGWVTPDSDLPVVVYPGQEVDPRAWRQLRLPRLLGVDRRPDGLAWHIERWTQVGSGDAWIELDGRPRAVRMRVSVLYSKGTPNVMESTFTYDGIDQRPPPTRPQPPPDIGGPALRDRVDRSPMGGHVRIGEGALVQCRTAGVSSSSSQGTGSPCSARHQGFGHTQELESLHWRAGRRALSRGPAAGGSPFRQASSTSSFGCPSGPTP